mmetsp:Transcript_1354/g.1986  ORF Transcript_1354/g.1986 Transcript_1354/m.1986 type:complete len:122 (+) Transcript_1354:91-456(+)
MPDQVLRREMLFEKIPNFFFLCMFNRLAPTTTSSATPNIEVSCKMICRLIQYTRKNNYRSFTVEDYKDRSKVKKLIPMISNYLSRNSDKLFQGIKEESDGACSWNLMFWERPFNPNEYRFN